MQKKELHICTEQTGKETNFNLIYQRNLGSKRNSYTNVFWGKQTPPLNRTIVKLKRRTQRKSHTLPHVCRPGGLSSSPGSCKCSVFAAIKVKERITVIICKNFYFIIHVAIFFFCGITYI